VEFGLFIQGYLPGPDAHDPDREREMFMREVELIGLADRTNWKYVWFSEHHCLTEYSHCSSSEVFMGYLAHATERIHLGSGIFNLSPRVNHPVRNAERAAMLDQLSGGRFEMGTGRGAGSHEVATFGIHDTSSTRAEWDEVVWEIPRMWETEEYTFAGSFFEVDTPHNVLPKPYRGIHPPIWVACGNPPTFEKAGRHGIGALGFNFSPIHDMQLLPDTHSHPFRTSVSIPQSAPTQKPRVLRFSLNHRSQASRQGAAVALLQSLHRRLLGAHEMKAPIFLTITSTRPTIAKFTKTQVSMHTSVELEAVAIVSNNLEDGLLPWPTPNPCQSPSKAASTRHRRC